MISKTCVILLTIAVFKYAQKTKDLPIVKELSPIFISGLVIIFLLKIFHIDYSIYKSGATFFTYLLIPATIALGYPLYKNMSLLTKNKRVVYVAFLLSAIIALLSTFVTGKLSHADIQLIISMLPKSITAPMAVEASKELGGIPELTACVVVLTGIFGAIFGHKILSLINIKNDVAIGIAIGASSHVIGTSKCIEKGKEKQVVMSTLSLVVVGILTVAIAPIIWKLILMLIHR